MSFGRRNPIGAALLAALALAACAPRLSEPPQLPYQKVSALVHFPDFYPGLGTLYVQPTTLPYGPFRGYDRNGELVNTIYMVPLHDLDRHASIRNIQGTPLPVDHVEIYFNSGHPGVEMPHYHIVLWHVSAERQKTLQ
ncbi:MAG: hypothetical protein JOY71_09685 [Acetobacteraceae bacterium]|nr:hypothetical protein [Acetobacteraceae bacterium]